LKSAVKESSDRCRRRGYAAVSEKDNVQDFKSSQAFKIRIASKLALALVADIMVFFVFMRLATSGGGNAIGAGSAGIFCLFPRHFLSWPGSSLSPDIVEG